MVILYRVEKRPWVVRANQGIVKESSGSSDDEVGGDSWPGTLIYVSCGWQAFKKVQFPKCKAFVSHNPCIAH